MGYSGIPEGAALELDGATERVRSVINGKMGRYGTTWRLDEGAYRTLAQRTGGHPVPLDCAIHKLITKLDPESGKAITGEMVKGLELTDDDFENWQYKKNAEQLIEAAFSR